MSHRFPNPGTGESLSGIFHSVEARVSARIVAPSALAFLNSQLFSDVRSFYFIGYFYFESLFCFWFFVFRFSFRCRRAFFNKTSTLAVDRDVFRVGRAPVE